MRVLVSVLVLTAMCLAIALELPPEVYRDMQKKAPEFLTIRVTGVKTKSTKVPGGTDVAVTATAVVERVVRSKSGLKPKGTITIRYVHKEFDEEVAGPSPVPVVRKGAVLPAYLAAAKGGGYGPAAGGYTFETVKM